MQKYHDTVLSNSGAGPVKPVAGAEVTVTTLAGDLATIYSDNGVTPKANPITTNDKGYYDFYAADGRYTLTIWSGASNQTVSDILLEDPADNPPPPVSSFMAAALVAEDAEEAQLAIDAPSASRLAVRWAGPILGIIGDSRAAASYTTTGVAPSTSKKFAPNSIVGWATFLSEQRIRSGSLWNKAVSGSLVSDLDGQFTNLLAVTPRCTHVYVLTGTNSLAAGTPASTCWSQLAAVLDRIRNAGMQAIVSTDLPRTVASMTTAYSQQSHQFNQLIRLNAPALGAMVVDPMRYLADPSNADGDPHSGYYYDGIHPATLGAYYAGLDLSNAILGRIPAGTLPGFASRGDVFNATNNPYGNALGNGMFAGTAGTNTSSGGAASGTVADGWNNRTLTGTGTSEASLIARTDGKPGWWQQLVQTSAGGVSEYRFSQITNPTRGTNYPADASLVLEFDLDVSGASGVEALGFAITNFDGVTVMDNVTCFGSAQIASTYYPFPAAFSGRVRSEPLAYNSLADRLLVRFETRINNGAATIKLGNVELRRV